MVEEGPVRENALKGECVRYRLATTADLVACREFVPQGLRLSPRSRRQLVNIWEDMLASEAVNFVIIEDPAGSHPGNIEAFALRVFVSEAFTDDFLRTPKPYLPAIFYEQILAGRSPILSRAQIAEANASSGLQGVVLHFGLRHFDLANSRTQAALQCGSAAFYFFHAGFRIKRMLNEVYGAPSVSLMTAGGGFEPLDDASLDMNRSLADVTPELRPHIFVLNAAKLAPGAIFPLSFLFHPSPPKLGLSPTEQRVLERALLNESDGEIASRTGVSADAIKKTWRQVYQRVALKAPYLFPNGENRHGTSRSAEKRRHLLEHLRGHLEELRPFKKPRHVSAPRRSLRR
jgi:DNA-binding CsgD family transcriptional regulator